MVVGEGKAITEEETEFGELFNASAFIASMKDVGMQVILILLEKWSHLEFLIDTLCENTGDRW